MTATDGEHALVRCSDPKACDELHVERWELDGGGFAWTWRCPTAESHDFTTRNAALADVRRAHKAPTNARRPEDG